MLTTTWRGGVLILSGGTRNAVNLDRPWQPPLDDLFSRQCSFETRKQDVHIDGIIFGDEEWLVIRNLATSWTEIHPDRFIIIPQKCWTQEKLRLLGGREKITNALSIAGRLLCRSEHEKFEFCIHVGSTAGQNEKHAHLHLVPLPWLTTIPVNPPDRVAAKTKPALQQTDEDFLVFCDGTRTGQCFVLPKEPIEMSDEGAVLSLAEKLSNLIKLQNNAFRSTQGLPPDFVLGGIIINRELHYATLIPILSQWGGPEYFAAMEGSPYSLRWSHELSAEHLNKND